MPSSASGASVFPAAVCLAPDPLVADTEVARALMPVPTGPAGPQNSMRTLAPAAWRRHSCLMRPDSSGRLSSPHGATPRKGAFEAAAPRLVSALFFPPGEPS